MRKTDQFQRCEQISADKSGIVFGTGKHKRLAKDKGGLPQMLKDFAWNTFIKTGIIESYIFYKEIEERDRAAEQRRMAEAETAAGRLGELKCTV